MAWTKEERELIEQKFKNVDDKLDYIKTQVDKTNGRVTVLEKGEIEHIINCPQKPRMDKLEEELIELRMFRRYPKFFIISSFVLGLFMVLMSLKTLGII